MAHFQMDDTNKRVLRILVAFALSHQFCTYRRVLNFVSAFCSVILSIKFVLRFRTFTVRLASLYQRRVCLWAESLIGIKLLHYFITLVIRWHEQFPRIQLLISGDQAFHWSLPRSLLLLMFSFLEKHLRWPLLQFVLVFERYIQGKAMSRQITSFESVKNRANSIPFWTPFISPLLIYFTLHLQITRPNHILLSSHVFFFFR